MKAGFAAAATALHIASSSTFERIPPCLTALQRRNEQSLVDTRRSKLKQFEAELLAKGWGQVREGVEVKRIPMPGDEETCVLCRMRVRGERLRLWGGRAPRR